MCLNCINRHLSSIHIILYMILCNMYICSSLTIIRRGMLTREICSCPIAKSYMNSEYEAAAAPLKKMLFSHLFPPNHSSESFIVVELGICLFSNAPYYPRTVNQQLNIIGIEPDIERHALAIAVAEHHGLNLCNIKCHAENLPFADSSIDAVVSTCTLCTVQDPAKVLQEVKRVLKPGCRLLFWEHVLSETNTEVAKLQMEASDEEFKNWGCRFDKRSLEEVKNAEFANLFGIHRDEECYFELPNCQLMGPTAAGVATRNTT